MKLKTFEQILFGMIVWFKGLSKKVTDFNVGSTLRTIMEAVAIELEELYASLNQAVEKAIRESAYKTFGFDLLPAVPSYARVKFNLAPGYSPFTIPSGTRVSTREGLVFTTIEETYVDGIVSDIDIIVKCSTPGTIGNVGADTITVLVDYIRVVESVNNELPAMGGENKEPPSKRSQRFSAYVNSLGKGTISSIKYALSTIPEIASVKLVEDLPGILYVYICNAQGAADDTLINTAVTTLNNWRAGGIQTNVLPIVLKPTDINITAYVTQGVNKDLYKERIKNSVVDYLNNLDVGEDLFISHLISSAISVNKKIIKSVYLTELTERDVNEEILNHYTEEFPTRVIMNDNEIIKSRQINVVVQVSPDE